MCVSSGLAVTFASVVFFLLVVTVNDGTRRAIRSKRWLCTVSFLWKLSHCNQINLMNVKCGVLGIYVQFIYFFFWLLIEVDPAVVSVL